MIMHMFDQYSYLCEDVVNCAHSASFCSNLILGDSGFNSITFNMDLPKIYEVYRALDGPSPFVIPEFGAVFSADYKLYPSPYRQLDSLGSFIDMTVTIDDLQTDR